MVQIPAVKKSSLFPQRLNGDPRKFKPGLEAPIGREHDRIKQTQTGENEM